MFVKIWGKIVQKYPSNASAGWAHLWLRRSPLKSKPYSGIEWRPLWPICVGTTDRATAGVSVGHFGTVRLKFHCQNLFRETARYRDGWEGDGFLVLFIWRLLTSCVTFWAYRGQFEGGAIVPFCAFFSPLADVYYATPCQATRDCLKADSHIACHVHAVPMPFPTMPCRWGFRMCLSHLI
jgi:hypothetical protein